MILVLSDEERKAKVKARQSTPEYKAKRKARLSKPENKVNDCVCFCEISSYNAGSRLRLIANLQFRLRLPLPFRLNETNSIATRLFLPQQQLQLRDHIIPPWVGHLLG